MKISFIEPHLKIYGGIRRIIELSNRLTIKGHDVTIFHSKGQPCDWMKCIAKVKCYDAILSENHDVVIFNDPNPIDYKLVEKSSAKLKVFYVLELYDKRLLKGFHPKIYLPNNKRMLILKKCLELPYLKLVNASWEQKWIEDNLNIKTKLVLGGINTEMFRPVEVNKDKNKISILYSGDPRKRKGTNIITKAVGMVRKEVPNIIEDTYYNKGIPQERMAEKYSWADIFIEASYQAGWCNPVVEAMACKTSVICTNIGGVQDFAFHDKTALLVPVCNAEAIRFSIIKLIRNKKLRDCLSANAYNYIRRFSWDRTVSQLEKILIAGLNEK